MLEVAVPVVNDKSPLTLLDVWPEKSFMPPLLPVVPPLLLLNDKKPEDDAADSPVLIFIVPPVVPFSAVIPEKISICPPGPFRFLPTLIKIFPPLLSCDDPDNKLISPEFPVVEAPV